VTGNLTCGRFAPHVGTRASDVRASYLSLMSAAPHTPYELLGGDAGIRRLVDRFYDLIDTAPEAATIRALHAASLKTSREKLYMYLTGWTGGPPIYVEKFGHPRLRARHLPFSIGERERDEWLWCMDHALAEHDLPEWLRADLTEKLHGLANHVRNRAE
jgi:hemoglobin